MQFKIGFALSEEKKEETTAPASAPVVPDERLPRRSVVRVHFPQRNMTLAYYNDRFDLHRGDLVYVDGKLEGMRGRVVDVNYNFRIDLADYKRVIAVCSRRVASCDIRPRGDSAPEGGELVQGAAKAGHEVCLRLGRELFPAA